MKGFISITILAIITLSTIVLSGAGFGAYKYHEIQKENAQIKAELDQQKDTEITLLREKIEVGTLNSSSTVTVASSTEGIVPLVEIDAQTNNSVNESDASISNTENITAQSITPKNTESPEPVDKTQDLPNDNFNSSYILVWEKEVDKAVDVLETVEMMEQGINKRKENMTGYKSSVKRISSILGEYYEEDLGYVIDMIDEDIYNRNIDLSELNTFSSALEEIIANKEVVSDGLMKKVKTREELITFIKDLEENSSVDYYYKQSYVLWDNYIIDTKKRDKYYEDTVAYLQKILDQREESVSKQEAITEIRYVPRVQIPTVNNTHCTFSGETLNCQSFNF